MRASLAEQMQEWVKVNNFKSSLPPCLLSPLPTCTVHLYIKHLGLSKDKQDAIVLRDRNTVLETLRHKPAYRKHKLKKEYLTVKGFTPDSFMFAAMPAQEAAHLM